MAISMRASLCKSTYGPSFTSRAQSPKSCVPVIAKPFAGSHAQNVLLKTSSVAACKVTLAKSRSTSVTVCAAAKTIYDDRGLQEDDYICLGRAHCFEHGEGGRLVDLFLIEPLTAGSVEAVFNGARTSYTAITSVSLGEATKLARDKDTSVLPKEFHSAAVANNFEYRAECAARTWLRPHAQENTKKLVDHMVVKSDFNFNIKDHPRIIGVVNEVSDSDNIKQDLSIDVYGRKKDEEDKGKGDLDKEIERLSNM